MQGDQFIIVIAAYKPEEYKKIQELSEDGNSMDPTWTEWRRTANQTKAQFAMRGIKCVEKLIGTEGLLKHCLENGLRVDQAARSSYAQWLYEKEKDELLQEAIDEFEEEEEGPQPQPYLYSAPLDKLLTTTDTDASPHSDINYVEQFGLGPEHIPDLIRMATDDYLASDDATESEYNATLHAVYALTEIHANEAIDPLLAIYDKCSKTDNEFMLETLLDFFATIGPAALPSLEQFLADPLHDESAQGYVAESIGKMAEKYPEARAECIAVVTRRLEDFEVNDPGLNASLIGDLIKMKVVEAAPLIERAYASGRVDELFCGDWNEVQYELGLKERPPTKDKPHTLPSLLAPTRSTLGITSKPAKKSSPSKKAKTKMVKASKKANRRKK
jgi:hypothetical protein